MNHCIPLIETFGGENAPHAVHIGNERRTVYGWAHWMGVGLRCIKRSVMHFFGGRGLYMRT